MNKKEFVLQRPQWQLQPKWQQPRVKLKEIKKGKFKKEKAFNHFGSE